MFRRAEKGRCLVERRSLIMSQDVAGVGSFLYRPSMISMMHEVVRKFAEEWRDVGINVVKFGSCILPSQERDSQTKQPHRLRKYNFSAWIASKPRLFSWSSNTFGSGLNKSASPKPSSETWRRRNIKRGRKC